MLTTRALLYNLNQVQSIHSTLVKAQLQHQTDLCQWVGHQVLEGLERPVVMDSLRAL